MSRPGKKYTRLLICEGPDDIAFFQMLIERRGLPRFHVRDARGKKDKSAGNTGFARALRAHQIDKELGSIRDILIVSDNDQDPDKSFKNVCDQIRSVYGDDSVPKKPLEKKGRSPSIRILMIPWEGKLGNLEILCQAAARSSDLTMAAHVDNFDAVIGAERWGRVGRREKMWLRTNLAIRCERDPFVFLSRIFREYDGLIPLNDRSFDCISNVLESFAPKSKRRK